MKNTTFYIHIIFHIVLCYIIFRKQVLQQISLSFSPHRSQSLSQRLDSQDFKHHPSITATP